MAVWSMVYRVALTTPLLLAALVQAAPTPEPLRRLLCAYPDLLQAAAENLLVWKDGETMPYDDGVTKREYDDLLNHPSLKDQLSLAYPKGPLDRPPAVDSDPGRIRYEPFFKKMYGGSEAAVRKRLVPVAWLPATGRQTLYVTSVNGVDRRLQAVSDELERLPVGQAFPAGRTGAFQWRTIAGTGRLSTHSFGIAVDLPVRQSDYWRWEAGDGHRLLPYRNRIPQAIVEVFERHGFIWGGKWYHFDTMHFEYRPELLSDDATACGDRAGPIVPSSIAAADRAPIHESAPRR